MKSIIVIDSTSTITIDEAKKNNFILIPLNVNLDSKTYLDAYEVSYDFLYQVLKDEKLPTTSQPSIGYVEEVFKKLKKENYQHIYVLSLSSGLSGTYQTFNLAKEMTKLDNATIIDTKTLGCPIKNLAYKLKTMIDNNCNHQEIMDTVKKHIDNTHSFLYPSDLNHLKRGGRISTLAYGLASFLKIKALLKLKEDGSTIEKFDTFKTEKRLYQNLFETLKNLSFNPKTHKLYFTHSLEDDKIQNIIELAKTFFLDLEIEIIKLPAVLMCHAGLNAIAIQMVIK